MNIEPSLKSFLEPYITMGRATFARDTDDETLTNTALLTFAGMGLVKAVVANGETIWVKTEKLKEVEKTPPAPVDLSPFMEAPVEKSGEPEMSNSLRLIVEDIITIGRKNQPELAENMTVDSTLLGLAGQGLVLFVDGPDDKCVWVAHADLIDHFDLGRDGIASFASRRRAEIRVDAALKNVTKEYYKMSKALFDGGYSKRAVKIYTLLTLEMNGEAVAYKDDQGCLAWKASGDLRKSFEFLRIGAVSWSMEVPVRHLHLTITKFRLTYLRTARG